MDSIKLDLTNDRLESLHEFITYNLKEWRPETVADRLVWMMVDKLNEKIRAKVRRINQSMNVSTKMVWKADEAMGFYCWFQRLTSYVNEGDFHYELMVGQALFDEIDRKYG